MKKIILLSLLFTLYFSLSHAHAQDYKKIDSLKKVLNSLPPLNGTETDTMRMKISLDIGDLFETSKPDTAIYWYTTIVDTVFSVSKIKQTPRKAHFNATALRYIGIVFMDQGDYTKAINYYEKSLKMKEELEDKKGISACLMNLGIVFYNQGDYPKVINYYEKSLKIDEELGDKKGISACLMNLGIVFMYQGDYLKAINYYEKSLKIAEELADKSGISNCLSNLGLVFFDQGDFPKAIEYQEKSLKIREELGDKSGISRCFTNLGVVFYYQGDYPKAINYYEKSLKIKKETDDKKGISACLSNLGLVFFDQGDFPKAIEYQEKSLKIREELGDKSGISFCLINLGVVFRHQGDCPKAISYYEKSLKISVQLCDKSKIASCLINLGVVFDDQGDYPKAINYYEKSLKLYEELGDKGNTSKCITNLGVVFWNQGDYPKAINYYEKSLKIMEELGMFADLADDYPDLAIVYVKQQKYNQASSLYIKSIQMKRKLIQDNFSILSEKEKGLFLENTGNVFNTVNEFASMTKSDSILSQCYDNTLLLKGLLLQSSRGVMDAVSKSTDTSLVNTYWRFKKLRTDISDLYSTPINEREQNLDSLENIANDLERKLVMLSKDYSEIKKQYNYKWENVQTALKKDEAAIEFVKINCDLLLKQTPVKIDTIQNSKGIRDSVVYTKEKNDSTFYAAFIIRPGYKSPKMISLFDEKKLEEILNKMKSNRGVQILDQPVTKEKSRELYDLIWLPLEKELKGVKSIYYSPDGLLYKVSFAAMTSPENKFLFDTYNLKTLNSTREIIAQNKSLFIQPDFTCSIYGGIQYNLDANKLITNAKKYKPDENFDLALNEKVDPKDIKRGGEWNFLKGTMIEADAINKELQASKISTTLFTGEFANEESFKSLSSKSPSIIHIATHGFYIADNKSKNTDLEAGNNFKFNKNPLFRSGLIMAGVNRVWTGNKPIDGVDDGILTAFEVSNLDLSNTKLVVLSACETGLGDIKGSEGVYGLQRAFKMAGVQYMITTLWEIQDEVTVEFMKVFYQQWLKGKEIHDAFKLAQVEMRKKYEANYWAAFVLVE